MQPKIGTADHIYDTVDLIDLIDLTDLTDLTDLIDVIDLYTSTARLHWAPHESVCTGHGLLLQAYRFQENPRSHVAVRPAGPSGQRRRPK